MKQRHHKGLRLHSEWVRPQNQEDGSDHLLFNPLVREGSPTLNIKKWLDPQHQQWTDEISSLLVTYTQPGRAKTPQSTQGHEENALKAERPSRGWGGQALWWQDEMVPCSCRRMWLICWNTSVSWQGGEAHEVKTKWDAAGLADKGASRMGNPSCWVGGIWDDSRGLTAQSMGPREAQRCQEAHEISDLSVHAWLQTNNSVIPPHFPRFTPPHKPTDQPLYLFHQTRWGRCAKVEWALVWGPAGKSWGSSSAVRHLYSSEQAPEPSWNFVFFYAR